MTPAQQRALWDAINKYVAACGGDPSKNVGSTARQLAVFEVEEAMGDTEEAAKKAGGQ